MPFSSQVTLSRSESRPRATPIGGNYECQVRSKRTHAEPPFWRKSLLRGGADHGAQIRAISTRPTPVAGRLNRRSVVPRLTDLHVMPMSARFHRFLVALLGEQL